MQKEKDDIIQSLLEKPLWQFNGRDFVELSRYSQMQQGYSVSSTPAIAKITGIHALAEHLGCCESTVYHLKRNGVLDKAIISHIGKKIVFDGEKARELAAAYQLEQRTAK